jgi:membrane protein
MPSFEEILARLMPLMLLFRPAGSLLKYIASRFSGDKCLRIAASLSYTSLLALVPMLAISLSILSAFPVFDEARDGIQQLIFENFAPNTGEALSEYIQTFVRNTTGLTAVGIVGIAATSVMLLATIEDALNTIFRVEKKRPFVGRMLVFWAVLTLGPLLMGASFSLSSYFYALTKVLDTGVASGLTQLLRDLVPVILSAAGFAVMYIFMPNRPVKLRHAAVGALAAAILFETLKSAFTSLVIGGGTYSTIYGAMATVPIFLVWMYVSWTVVLFGALLTAALPDWMADRKYDPTVDTDPRKRLDRALAVLAAMLEDSRSTGTLTQDELVTAVGRGEHEILGALEELYDAGFIEQTADDKWVLSRDLTTASVYEIYDSFGCTIHAEDNPDLAPEAADWRKRLNDLCAGIDESNRQTLSMSIAAFLEARQSPEVKAAE